MYNPSKHHESETNVADVPESTPSPALPTITTQLIPEMPSSTLPQLPDPGDLSRITSVPGNGVNSTRGGGDSIISNKYGSTTPDVPNQQQQQQQRQQQRFLPDQANQQLRRSSTANLVESIVPATDDPSQPALTFRVLLLGTIFTIALSFVNQLYWFRENPIVVGVWLVQLLAFPFGIFLARVLPVHCQEIRVGPYTIPLCLNPGPFSIKEHVLITIMANAGAGTAYSIEIIVIQRLKFGQPLGLGYGFLILLTSQCLGYSLAGLFRRLLVDPPAMVWPATLTNVAMFKALSETKSFVLGFASSTTLPPSVAPEGQDRDQQQQRSSDDDGSEDMGSELMHKDTIYANGHSLIRVEFFWLAMLASFLWHFVPGWLFTSLSMLPLLCIIAPSNVIANQLGDGSHGLGILSLALDWAAFSNSYVGNPLATPFWVGLNVFAGFVLMMWVLTPLGYYLNVWDTQNLPIYTATVYRPNGEPYQPEKVMTDGRLDEQKYHEYGPMRFTFQFGVCYAWAFALLTAVLTHVALYHGKLIVRGLVQTFPWIRPHVTAISGDRWNSSSRCGTMGCQRAECGYEGSEGAPSTKVDIHYQLMQAYKQVPNLWYLALLVIMAAAAAVTCNLSGVMPWYSLIFSVTLGLLFIGPIGIIQAISNQQPGLGVLTEMVAGYIMPGRPIANLAFKAYGKMVMSQGLLLVQDLKLGHYMKVPPRSMFVCQLLGTVTAVIVQLLVAEYLMRSVEGICTEKSTVWTCRTMEGAYSATLIWGLIGPKKQFGEGSPYSPLLWFFLVGVFLPVPFWYFSRRYPRVQWFRFINVPLILSVSNSLPNAPTVDYVMWFLAVTASGFFVRRYLYQFWVKYNYVLAASLDLGLAIAGIVVFFAFGSARLTWWGTKKSHCPTNVPYSQVHGHNGQL